MFNPSNLLGRGLHKPPSGDPLNPALLEQHRLISQGKNALGMLNRGSTTYQSPQAQQPLNEVDAFGRGMTDRANFNDRMQAFSGALTQQQPYQQQTFQQMYQPTQPMVQPEQPQQQDPYGQAERGGMSGVGGTNMSGYDVNRSNAGSVIANATKYAGIPYKWGGTNPKTGLDCSGFTMNAARDSGEDISRTTGSQMQYFQSKNRWSTSMADAKPGDMLYFATNGPSGRHTGIYLGGGRMIHAGSKGVATANIGKRKLLGVGRM